MGPGFVILGIYPRTQGEVAFGGFSGRWLVKRRARDAFLLSLDLKGDFFLCDAYVFYLHQCVTNKQPFE